MIKAAIAGATGITGGELIRLLINHPKVQIGKIYSSSSAGENINAIHPDLYGDISLELTGSTDFREMDVLFLCLPHGASREFLTNAVLHDDLKIIDLGSDFRLKENNKLGDRRFVYGLTESCSGTIAGADNIANPGCFATAIELSLMPLADKKMINSGININAVTGSTGAGAAITEHTGFNKRHSNYSTYSQFNHRHLFEIKETLGKFQGDLPEFNFIPARGGFTRGIHASIFLDINENLDTIDEIYRDCYLSSPFVHVVDFEPEIKMLVNTNKCFINLKKSGNKLLITTVLDNLLKGAAGQAVQNMNLMFGMNETLGLKLKSAAY